MAESKPTSESAHELEPKREPREPRALSSEYHKARKQLMLWASILFVWELVGIDLEKAKEVGGNFGAIITAIKSPQAVPWALLILVGYFLFKVTVEWYQCNPGRRTMRVARVDFMSAWIVALTAYALYIGQTISRVQFADRLVALGIGGFMGYVVGLMTAAATVYGVRRGIKILRRQINVPRSFAILWFSLGPLTPLLGLLASRLQGYTLRWSFVLVGAAMGGTLLAVVVTALKWRVLFRVAAQQAPQIEFWFVKAVIPKIILPKRHILG